MSTITREPIQCFAGNEIDVPENLRIASTGEYPEANKNQGIFRIMTPKDGDKRVVWNKMILAEINAAKKMFCDLLSKGMVPYKVGVDGKASAEQMQEFDPVAEEVIFIPIRAIAGG